MLARLRALTALYRTYGVGGVTVSVYKEVVTRGKEKGLADAFRVETAVSQGQLRVLDLTPAEKKFAQTLVARAQGLSQTDRETLACAKERALTLLIEERRGRKVARAHNISYITIQVFPLYGLIRGSLTVRQCDPLLMRIGQVMHTDLAVLEALRTAAQEIGRMRGKE